MPDTRAARRLAVTTLTLVALATCGATACRDEPAGDPGVTATEPAEPPPIARTPDEALRAGPLAIDPALARRLVPPGAPRRAFVDLNELRGAGLLDAWLPALVADDTLVALLTGDDALELDVALAWSTAPGRTLPGDGSIGAVLVGRDVERATPGLAAAFARAPAPAPGQQFTLTLAAPPDTAATDTAMSERARQLADALSVTWQHTDALSETSLVVADAVPPTWWAWLGPHAIVVGRRTPTRDAGVGQDEPNAPARDQAARVEAALRRPAPPIWPLHTEILEVRAQLGEGEGDESVVVRLGIGDARLYLDATLPLDAVGVPLERAEGLVQLLGGLPLMPDPALRAAVAEGPWPSALDEAAALTLREMRATLDREARVLEVQASPRLEAIRAAAP